MSAAAGHLRVEGLRIATRRHGQPLELVRGIDLDIRRGQVTALVGASGSGKSLTCLALQGLMPPGVECLDGRVLLDGREVAPATLRGRQVATVMQAPRSAFNPVLTMAAHARETLAARGITGSDAERRILAALAETGLAEPERVLRLHAFQMSGGMLQRMMLALALMSEAPFLLADEPTTDLDLVLQAQVLALIERLAVSRDLGVLLVTHDMGVVARLADHVAVMDHGRIVETGTAADIFASPRAAPTRALVAAHLALYPEEEVAP
ncbi:ATP-binding cassette domain-containing protein [Telmatospirillum sp. J64-1]|uniref:ATP-binding cassette domain-containing protein n=1 Tax=Telmatospirillum sp. J64-1 TaxID=2502183 RepID=UPI00115EDC28|nr:ATP-binding cassette domain-containing protein [Telmatospirillum sp. J64-1]